MSEPSSQTETAQTEAAGKPESGQAPVKRPRSWKRRIAITVLVLVLILVGVLTVALLNLENLIERNRELIVGQIEQALGREFTVDSLKVNIFTGGRIQLTNITIADDPRYSSEVFFRADEFQVRVALLPLLRKEIRLGRLVVVHPQITVIRDGDGQLNVSTIGAGESVETEPAPESSTPTELPSLAVHNIDVKGGTLLYRDMATQSEFRIDDLGLRVSNLQFERPVAFELEAAVLSERENLTLRGQVGPLGKSLDFENIPFDIQLGIDSLDVGNVLAAAETLGIESPLPEELRVQGPLSLEVQTNRTNGELPLTVSLDATRNTNEYASDFRKPADVPLHVRADVRLTPEAITIQSSEVELQNIKASVSGKVGLAETMPAQLAVRAERIALSGLDELLPILKEYSLSGDVGFDGSVQHALLGTDMPVVDGTVSFNNVEAEVAQLRKRPSGLSGELVVGENRAELRETKVGVGASRLQLSAKAESLVPLILNYHVSIDELNLADFAAPLMESRNPDVVRKVAVEGNVDWNWGTWNQLDLDIGKMTSQGVFSSASGMVADVPYTALQTDFRLAKQEFKLQNLKLQTCEGTIEGEAACGFHPDRQAVMTRLAVRDMDITALSKVASPDMTNPLRGRLDYDIDVTGEGLTWDELRPTLRGTTRAEVRNGWLPGVNVVQSILSPMTKVPGLGRLFQPVVKNPLTDLLAVGHTEFSELKTSATIQQEKAHVDVFTMQAKDWSIHGDGDVYLDQKIDAKAKLTLSPRFVSAIVRSVKEIGRVTEEGKPAGIPFVLKGTLPSVKPVPDVKSMAMVFPRLLGGTAGEIGGLAKTLLDGLIPSGKADAETASATQATQEKKNPIREGLGKLFRR